MVYTKKTTWITLGDNLTTKSSLQRLVTERRKNSGSGQYFGETQFAFFSVETRTNF